MKRVGAVLVCVGALAFPVASPAADGKGGAGLERHLARATAHVAKYVEKCKVAEPPAKCDAVKARLAERLAAWKTRIEERIAKLDSRPDSDKKSARLAQLQDALTQIAALQAQL